MVWQAIFTLVSHASQCRNASEARHGDKTAPFGRDKLPLQASRRSLNCRTGLRHARQPVRRFCRTNAFTASGSRPGRALIGSKLAWSPSAISVISLSAAGSRTGFATERDISWLSMLSSGACGTKKSAAPAGELKAGSGGSRAAMALPTAPVVPHTLSLTRNTCPGKCVSCLICICLWPEDDVDGHTT